MLAKGKQDPFIVSGTTVTEGTGEMIVCAVGSHSTLGKNTELISTRYIGD